MNSPAGMGALLLLLLDSRSPAGAHAHSAGMEAAVEAGFVRDIDDVHEFCAARLHTSGRVGAAFAALSALAWTRTSTPTEWELIDAEYTARTSAEATRAASRALGSGLLRLLRASVPAPTVAQLHAAWHQVPAPAPHQPLVLGAACAIAGAGPVQAARASALGTCTASASAALRLLGLDPYRVHAVTASLTTGIDELAEQVGAPLIGSAASIGALVAGLPTDSAPAMDVLAEFHLLQEVRLFAS